MKFYNSTVVKQIKLSISFLFSGLALLIYIFLEVPLLYSLIFFSVLFAAFIYSTWQGLNPLRKKSLTLDITKGIQIGIIATIVYDAIRLLLYSTHAVSLFPFETFYLFGVAFVGPTASYNIAFCVGLCYHILNGLTFSISYRICFKNKSFLYGVIGSLILEIMMLTAYSTWLNLNSKMTDFLIISLVGHFSYGITIGALNQYKFKQK